MKRFTVAIQTQIHPNQSCGKGPWGRRRARRDPDSAGTCWTGWLALWRRNIITVGKDKHATKQTEIKGNTLAIQSGQSEASAGRSDSSGAPRWPPWLPAHSPLSHGETQSVFKSFYLPCATPPPPLWPPPNPSSLSLCGSLPRSLAASLGNIPDRWGHSLAIQPCGANRSCIQLRAAAEQHGPLIALCHTGKGRNIEALLTEKNKTKKQTQQRGDGQVKYPQWMIPENPFRHLTVVQTCVKLCDFNVLKIKNYWIYLLKSTMWDSDERHLTLHSQYTRVVAHVLHMLTCHSLSSIFNEYFSPPNQPWVGKVTIFKLKQQVPCRTDRGQWCAARHIAHK